MRRGMGVAVKIGLLALALYLTAGGLKGAAALKETEKTLTLVSQGEEWKAGEIRAFLREQDGQDGEESGVDFVLWGQEGEVNLLEKETGRTCQAEILFLCGSSRLLYPGGQILDEEDEEGCLIGKKSARELFQTEQVVGRKITFQNRAYQIRGVLEEESSMLLVRAEDQRTLERVTARVGVDQTCLKVQSALEAAYGLTGKELKWRLLYGLAKLGNLALLTVMGLCIAWVVGRSGNRGVRWNKGRMCIFYLIFGLLWAVFLGSQFTFPQEYLPDQWSDFAFWSGLWEQTREELQILIKTGKRGPEVSIVLLFLQTVGRQAGGAVLWLLQAGMYVSEKIRHQECYASVKKCGMIEKMQENRITRRHT